MEASRRTVTPDDLIVISTPEDWPLLASTGQPIHVGLNIGSVLGQQAERAFAHYRVHTESEEFLNPKKAKAAEQRFIAIAGFSPTELLEKVYEIEERSGFSTRQPNLLHQSIG